MARLDQILDLVESTIYKYDRNKWIDLSSNLQHYTFADQIVGKKRLINDMNSTRCEWKIQTSFSQTTRYANLFDTDVYSVSDHLTNAYQDWAKFTDNWTYDIDEKTFNSGPEQIIDHIAVREHAMMTGLYEFLEEALWSSPASTSSNPREFLGIPFWIQKNATQGFNGGNPSAGNAGNVDVSTVEAWKNYTDTYSAVTATDAVEKIVRAITYCNFKTPHPYAEHTAAKTPDYALYTTYPVIEEFRRHVRSQNDNLGSDAAAMMKGMPSVMSMPLQWVPILDSADHDAQDTSDPIYGVNWNSFGFHTKSGEWMKRTSNLRVPGQHNVYANYVDAWGQFVCKNRRGNFVMYRT